MNKTQYRIIFNPSRGCLMAVAETAASQGKSASGQTRASRSAWPAAARAVLPVGPLQLACWLMAGVMGWSLPLMHTAQAQTTSTAVATRIVADTNAPKAQQATILRSGNGVIQANIQTPSSAGVSRNTYTQFDVGAEGAILNNSRNSSQTQQGGWVQANPWLANGTAKVILNEVNATNPSQLQGYVEVAGTKAEVVIANPAGIAVNGGGFINASRVTLTTGTAVMSGGTLDSYRVQGGTVRIDGQGLDTRGADYTAILTRALQVNAGVWANELHVVTGANDIQASSVAPGSSPTATAISNPSPAPTVALDVAQLGGMYAGKIHLIGTEAGLGVRNAGQIQANNGPLTLSNEGWLANSGSIQSTQDLSIRTQGRIDNTASIYAGGQLNISTPSDIVQTGKGAIMAAQSHATFTAATLSTAQGSAMGSGIQSDGKLADSGDLTINTTQGLQLQGQTLAGGLFKLSASSVDLTGAQVSAGQLDIRATSGNITTRDATISAIQKTGQLKLTTTDDAQLDNTRGIISGAQVQVSTGQLNNTQGHITAQNLSVDTHQHTLTNTRGTLLASQAVTLQTGALGNQAGLIQSGTQLSIDTHGQALNNTQASQYPGNAQGEGKGQGGLFAQGQLSVTTGQLNNDAGYIASKNALTLDTTSTANTSQGQILSLSDIRVQATGTLDNTQGLIRSASQTALNAQEVKNTNTLTDNSQVQTGIEGQAISITTVKLQNNQGAIRASQDVAILSSQQINNNAGLISAGQALSLQDPAVLQKAATAPTLAISNKAGTLIADKSLTIASQSLGGDGQILSKGDLSVRISSDFNNTSKVIANGNATVVAANVINSGNLQAGQTLRVQATDINNQADGQITAKTTQLQATGTLTNRGLVDGTDTQLDATTLNNIGTGRIYGDRLSIAATTVLNDSETLNGTKASAVIAARERLDIGAQTLTNREGALIFSAGDIYIGGQLDAQRHATGQAVTVNNLSLIHI
jgi:filamentous hemagglutinin